VNPATGAIVAEVPGASTADAEAAVARARRARPAWGALSFGERARALRRFARRLMLDPDLIPILMSESGKPRYEAEAIEVFYTCELIRYYTGRAGRRALRDDLRHPFLFANKRARVIHHPRGVVAVIGPWNWPLLNNFADTVAPLVAGNAVVLKPSPVTPLTSLHVAKLWAAEGLPPDVLQVVPGDADTGAALVATADMVFFTGSQATGRKIAAAAGQRLIPVVLELGGKSPMIVLRDADLVRAASSAAWSGFSNSGQVCIRTELIIVAEAGADAFTKLLAAEVAKLRHGPPSPNPSDAEGPSDVDVDVGAMTWPAQMDHLDRQIAEARAKGARIVTGGQRLTDRPGNFFPPTVLADVTPDMAVAREETFGPVLPIVRVPDAEAALALANDTSMGLSGSVWSGDAGRAAALARRLETGTVCVNDVLFNYFCVEAPLGGIKASGLGFRHGPEGLRQFCRVETVVENHPLLGFVSPFLARQLMFPYKGPVLRAIRWFMRRLY
jgi:acyl-CoA reductase-like NAD-dependent aldehyde dehydrogenase